MTFVPVARLQNVPPGAVLVAVAGEHEVALFNVAGRIFATESTCPHQGAPLSEGWVDDGCVTCPWHAWTFVLETGKMTLGEHGGIETFEVQIREGVIYVSTEPRTEARL